MSANKAQAWNALMCPPLGFGLNFFLLWLIFRRTPKEMMVHSRVLLQTCLTDCLILIVQTVGQQIIIYEQGHQFIAFFDGYMIRLFRTVFQMANALTILDMLWVICSHISIFGISLQFLYRYLVLVRNKKVTLCQYLVMLAVPTLCTCLFTLGLCYDTYQTVIVDNVDDAHYKTINNIDLDQQQPLFATAVFSEFTIILLALFAFMYACSYTVIFFCGWKMIGFLNRHASFNARLKELNRQLTWNLILMAIFPLLLQLMVLLTFVNMNYKIISFEFFFYTFFIYHWLPLLNPAASILTNRPYREVVTRKLHLCSSSTTTTIVTPIAPNGVP